MLMKAISDFLRRECARRRVAQQGEKHVVRFCRIPVLSILRYGVEQLFMLLRVEVAGKWGDRRIGVRVD